MMKVILFILIILAIDLIYFIVTKTIKNSEPSQKLNINQFFISHLYWIKVLSIYILVSLTMPLYGIDIFEISSGETCSNNNNGAGGSTKQGLVLTITECQNHANSIGVNFEGPFSEPNEEGCLKWGSGSPIEYMNTHGSNSSNAGNIPCPASVCYCKEDTANAGCDGVPNSGLVNDACGVCDGDGSSCAGCDGVPNSGQVNDACGVCGGDGSSCNVGCDGVPNSGQVNDACGICNGDGSSCAGCDGVSNSGLVNDICGVCGGDGSTCGCDGVTNSGVVNDACGVCGGDGSTCGPNTYNQEKFIFKTVEYTQNTSNQNCAIALGRQYCMGPSNATFDLVVAGTKARYHLNSYSSEGWGYSGLQSGNNEKVHKRIQQGNMPSTTDKNTFGNFLNGQSIFESNYTGPGGNGSAIFTFSTRGHRFFGWLFEPYTSGDAIAGRLDFKQTYNYNIFNSPQTFTNIYGNQVNEKLTFNFMFDYISKLVVMPSGGNEVLTISTYFDVWMHDKIYSNDFYNPPAGTTPSVEDANIEQFMIDIKINYKQQIGDKTIQFLFPFVENEPGYPYSEADYAGNYGEEFIVQRFFFEINKEGSNQNEELGIYLMSHAPGQPDDIYDLRYYDTHQPRESTPYTLEAMFYFSDISNQQYKLIKEFNSKEDLINLIKTNLINQPEDYVYFSGEINLEQIASESATIKMPPEFFHELFSGISDIYVRAPGTPSNTSPQTPNSWVDTNLDLSISPTGAMNIKYNGDVIND